MASDKNNQENRLISIVRKQLSFFAEICGLPPSTTSLLEESLSLLTKESLNHPVNQTYTGLSKINADGLPFQWSLNIGKQSPSVRFLCEAGHPGSSVIERTNLSFQKVRLLTDLLSLDYPEWLFDCVLPRILPAKIPDHWLSAVWFAMGANSKGILPKIYLNLNQGKILNRWKSVGWILRDLNRDLSLESLCEISVSASRGSLPIGVAFDLMPDGEPGRIKIYFRSIKADTKFLDRWYQACNAGHYSPMICDFLDCFPHDNEYPCDSFVVGLEFPAETTNNWCPTLKVDFGITKWMRGDYQIREGVLRALGLLNIPIEMYLKFLDKLGPAEMSKEKCIFHRFVGIGYETDGSFHINVYFEPFVSALPLKTSPGDHPPSKETLDEAIGKGLLFLKNSQKSNGSWVDFHLPVGESDIWVTAYVLYQLSSLQNNIPRHSLLNCRQRALNWLQITQKRTGGWSYNSVVEEDSDSTSLAVLAISAMNQAVSKKSFERLALYLTSDGGVSTYLEGAEQSKAWATSHCDVTPLALLALKDKLSPHTQQQALDFLLRQQRADGLWPSYWWVSPLYATYVTLTLFATHHFNIPRKNILFHTINRFNPSGAFETALHLNCITLLEVKESPKYTKDLLNLLNVQSPDGSWPSSPILRLTYPIVKRPWMKIDAGTIYRDLRNVFTTATVIGALARVLNGY